MSVNKEAKLIKNLKKAKEVPTRNGFGEALVDAAKTDEKIVVMFF